MATYTHAELKDHLAHERCKRFAYAGMEGGRDREMTVFWEISDNAHQEAVLFLDTFGVGDNYVDAQTAATQLLTDPVISNETHVGKWRVVRNYYDPQFPGRVFQVRRFGYLTTLLGEGDAIVWSEARVISGRDHIVFPGTGDPGPWYKGQTDDYVVIGWRNIAPLHGAVLAKQLVAKGNTPSNYWTPLGDADTFGNKWHLLPPTYETAQDGSEVLTVAFIKLGVTERSYGGIGAEIATTTISERLPEDQAGARVEALKALPVASRPADVGMSRDPVSGIVSVRYTQLSPTPDEIYYEITTEAGRHEWHKVAWEQEAPGLDWAGAGYIGNAGDVKPPPSRSPAATFTHMIRRVGSVRRNPQTGRWSYHVILSDAGSQIPHHPANPLVTYRIQWFDRRMWSIFANMYWDQRNLVCWRHEMKTFSTFHDANEAMGAHQPNPPTSYAGDGTPLWAGDPDPLPPREGAPQPRLIAPDRWLMQRRTVAWESGFYPNEPFT